MFYDNGCYPRVNDVNQITSMQYARNNNADKTKPYPFAEAGHHAYNTFLIAHELLYGTNYINNPDTLFSTGTSGVDWFAENDEAGWKKYGGIRVKAVVSVKGANGYTGIDYKVYVYSPATALGSNKYDVKI